MSNEISEKDVIVNFLMNGGKIFRRREGRRTITVAYKNSDGRLSYGATIHRQESPSDTFRRRPHNFTAVSRCIDNPVELAAVEVETQTELEKLLRDSLCENGCRSAVEK